MSKGSETCKGMDAVIFPKDGCRLGMFLRPSEVGQEVSATRDACPNRIDVKGSLYSPYCVATHLKYSPEVANGDSEFAGRIREAVETGPASADHRYLQDLEAGRLARKEGDPLAGAVRFRRSGEDGTANVSECQATCHHFCRTVREAALGALSTKGAEDDRKGKELEVLGEVR